VDIVTSGYGTNLIAPLMPIAMERKLLIMGIFGLANNEKYKYPNYFQISPNGPEPETSTALGFFDLAARQNPKPQTVAIVGADAEYPQNALVGARELIKKFGFKTVYDKTYPPSTTDYTPIVRAIKATNPDIVFVASYPPDSVGMLRAAQRIGPLFLIPVIALHSAIIEVRHSLSGLSDEPFILGVGHWILTQIKGVEEHPVNRSLDGESDFAAHEKFVRRDED